MSDLGLSAEEILAAIGPFPRAARGVLQNMLDDPTTRLKVQDHFRRLAGVILRNMLADTTARPMTEERLRESASSGLAAMEARMRSQKMCHHIINNAERVIARLRDQALAMNGRARGSSWPDQMVLFIPHVRQLLNQALCASRGAEYAWEAAVNIGHLCNLPAEGDDCKVFGGEEQCDGFHDQLDNLLVEICRKQEAAGDRDWLRSPERKWKVELMASSPSREIYIGEHNGKHPGEYRYKKVLTFLARFN